MTIAIDASILEDRRWTGVERFFAGLIQGFAGVALPAEVLIVSRTPIDFPFELPSGVRPVVIGSSRLPTSLWREIVLAPTLTRLGCQILHSGVTAIPLGPGRYHRIATVHELTWRHSEDPMRRMQLHKLRVGAAARFADRIIVNSCHTRDDLAAEHPAAQDKIRVVYPGIDPAFTPANEDSYAAAAIAAARARAGLPSGPYFISVGRIEPKKNVDKMLDALRARLPGSPSLLLIGRMLYEGETFDRMVTARGLEGRVIRPGFLPDADLIWLLRGSAALLYISEMEGFGFPPLEAMACGTPAIVSDKGAIPEITGDAAIIIPPEDREALIDFMHQVLENGELRRRLASAGLSRASSFTYEKGARSAAEVYRELL